ncbi:MAG: hypothetical protein AAB421_02195 [Patescibacteria group bacterium]
MRILVPGVAILLAFFSVFLLSTDITPSPSTAPDRPIRTKEVEQRPAHFSDSFWNEILQKQGAVAAHDTLLKIASQASDQDQHKLGHLFGKALYTTNGLAGFPICGVELNGGCVHEFVASAVHDQGVGVVQKLNSACQTRFTENDAITCQHGLGHGLITYFGYDTEALSKSLDACATITSKNHTKGCYGGAFMEYNLRTMRENTTRDYNSTQPFSPCFDLAPIYQNSCFFWLQQLWFRTEYNEKHTEETFAEVGSLCQKLEPVFREACFSGVGYGGAPEAGLNSEKTHAFCRAASRGDAQDFADCWVEAQKAVVH